MKNQATLVDQNHSAKGDVLFCSDRTEPEEMEAGLQRPQTNAGKDTYGSGPGRNPLISPTDPVRVA